MPLQTQSIKEKKKRVYDTYTLLIIIGGAILLRLLIAPYMNWSMELGVWANTTRALSQGYGLYDLMPYSYPPLWAYTYNFFVFIAQPFFSLDTIGFINQSLQPLSVELGSITPWVAHPFYSLLVKLPLIAADVALALIMAYGFLADKDERTKQIVCALWLYNPLVIFCSTIQAQFDVITSLFVAIATLALLKRWPLICGAALVIAIGYKLYPIFFVPLFFLGVLGLHKEHRYLNAILFSIPFILFGIYAVTSLGPLEVVQTALFRRLGTLEPGGLSVLPFVVFLKQQSWQALAATIVRNGALVLICAVATMPFWKRFAKHPDRIIVPALIFSSSVTLLFLTYITNPQYFVWVLPFILIAGYQLNMRVVPVYWSLSVIAMLFYLHILAFDVRLLLFPAYTYLTRWDLNPLVASIVTRFKAYDFLFHGVYNPFVLLLGLATAVLLVWVSARFFQATWEDV